LEVSLEGRSVRLQVPYVTFFTEVNTSTGSKVKVLYVTTNLNHRVSDLVEYVCLKVLKVVDTILHPYEVIQRTHSVEVIRTRTPACHKDRSVTKPRRVFFIVQNVGTVNDRNDTVRVELVVVVVVDVTVERENLYVV
jgi:hypothetical protein